MILIHFDGWGTTYDYWTTLSNKDLRPVGWSEFRTKKVKDNKWFFEEDVPNVRFDQPKNYLQNTGNEFRWENYLIENNISAVPFDYFTLVTKIIQFIYSN